MTVLFLVLAALVFPELLAKEEKIRIDFDKGSYWVNVTATWPSSTCIDTEAEYQVSIFVDDELESTSFVKTAQHVLENQPYWKIFTLQVESLCGGQLQHDAISTSVEIEPGKLGPVGHFAVDGSIAAPTFRWKPNAIDVKEATLYQVVTSSEGKTTERFVHEPNITLQNPLSPGSIISVAAEIKDTRSTDSFSSDVMRVVYTYESEKHEAALESLCAVQTPRTNAVKVYWSPVKYVENPTYSVTWLSPDRTEHSENTKSSAIEIEVQGKHGTVQEVSVLVRHPDTDGLQIIGSEAVTTFVYKSLPAPLFNLSKIEWNSATVDLVASEGNETLEFEVNGVRRLESKVVLKNLVHMRDYLVRARACFVGGICGDEGYYNFTFIAPLEIRDFVFKLVSSSELRASWRRPEGRDETTFAGYGLTLSEIRGDGGIHVIPYEVSSKETSFSFRCNGTDTLYTLAIFAYQEKEEQRISGPTSSLSIVVPRVNDNVASRAPTVKRITPSIEKVKLDMEGVTTKHVRLILMNHSGRWIRTYMLEVRGNNYEYDSVSQLAPYETYFGSLQSCAEDEVSKCGIPSHFDFKTLIGAPSPPTALEVTFVNKTCIEYRWEPPAHTGAPDIDHYELTLKKSDRIVASSNVSAEVSDSIFDRLQSGTAYVFEITAVNVNESGERFYSETASVTVSTTSSAPLWILVVVISIGVIAGTGFFLLKTRSGSGSLARETPRAEADL